MSMTRTQAWKNARAARGARIRLYYGNDHWSNIGKMAKGIRKVRHTRRKPQHKTIDKTKIL